MAKTKEQPIPADLLEMTLEQLQNEAHSHDHGEIREHRQKTAERRDLAQAELERLAQRRNDLNRAMIAKMEKEIKK